MKYRIFLILATMLAGLQGSAAETYKGPNALCVTQDGKTIYVVNTDSCEIAVLNAVENKIVKTISLGDVAPQGAALSADEKTLYVSGGGVKGKVLAVDLASGTITKTAAAGHTPMGVVRSPDGTRLFVCNRFTGDIGEYRLPDLQLTRTHKVVREPHAAVVTNDGKHLLVANAIPLAPTNYPDDPDVMDIYVSAEVTIINIATGESKPVLNLPNGSGSFLGMCISPDGRYVYVTGVLARFLAPTTQVDRGWMNTACIAVIDTTKLDGENNGFVNSVLLDDIDRGAANPWGITTSVDGQTIYVAIAGTSELIVINAVELHKKLDARAEAERLAKQSNTASAALATEVPNDLAYLVGLKKRIKLAGQGARAVALADSGIYVGMYYSDTLQRVDEATVKEARVKVTEIALGPTPVWTPERRGEIWWNDATLCFQHWQSCASCHLDARMDGYNWDLLNDGMGNPKNTKSLLLSHKTPPTMASGIRDNIELGWDTEKQGLQCIRTGFQFIHFTMPDEEKSKDIDAFLIAEKPVPSPYLVDGKLSAKAERGKKIFEDTRIGCAKCHPAPLFTDKKMHDVNTKFWHNDKSEFDTPTLIETWRTAPYLHDGRYVHMRDVFKIGLHGDVAGDVGSLTDEQIDDLVEYILSL